jgi:hypothetical protein
MENILINKENKNRLTSKYKYILSTLFVFLSLYMTSPKAPEQISKSLQPKTFITYSDNPEKPLVFQSAFENNHNNQIFPAHLPVIIPTEVKFSNFNFTYPYVRSGTIINKNEASEVLIANGCSAYLIGKKHALLEKHCSATTGDVVWSNIYPQGYASYVTNSYVYSITNSLGLKVLELEIELPDSKPIILNNTPSFLQLGDLVRVCGWGVATPGGSFPAPLSCATMTIGNIDTDSRFIHLLGTGTGFPTFGDSGTNASKYNPALNKWIAFGTQYGIEYSGGPAKVIMVMNSNPGAVKFIKSIVPDTKWFSQAYIPRITR